jgi:hypothetical protein
MEAVNQAEPTILDYFFEMSSHLRSLYFLVPWKTSRAGTTVFIRYEVLMLVKLFVNCGFL